MNEIDIPETRLLPVEEIEPNAWNPNEMNAEEFDLLVQEIREVGFIDPVQVVPMMDGGFRLLGGEHRWRAARVLEMEEIPATLLSDEKWQEEDLQKFVTVRLNQLHGKANTQKMISLYKEMEEKYGEKSLQRMFAYTDSDAWKKLVKTMKKAVQSSGLPKTAQDQFNSAADNANSVSDLSSILNTIFNQHGDTLEYSFMVFSFGGKEHLYIAMSKKTKTQMDKLIQHCKEWGRDINEIIPEVTKKWLKAAEEKEEEELSASTQAS
jgi:hypothetical protein